MSPLNALLSADIALAMLLVIAAGVVEPLLAYHANRYFDGNHPFHWAFDHIAQPLLRAAILVAFVLTAYPALYGAHVAPALAVLLEQGSLRLTNLLNVVFLCSLVLPLLPPFRNRVALAVPVQGLIAVAVVFGWYTQYLGATAASWWPGWAAALAIAAMAAIAHHIAAEIGHVIGQRIDALRDTTGYDRLTANAIELLAQTPVLLYYGLTLGRQIAI